MSARDKHLDHESLTADGFQAVAGAFLKTLLDALGTRGTGLLTPRRQS